MRNLTIHDALRMALEKWRNRDFIFCRAGNEFAAKTFENTVYDVWALAESLRNLGMADKHILICGENSYEWAISDLAVMGYVGVTVAANKEWKEYDLKNIVEIADVECIIYSNTKKEIIEKIKDDFDILYISMQDELPSLIKSGYELLNKKAIKDDFIIKDLNQMHKIIFTSGTTAASKAVMLPGRSMFFGFESLYRRAKMNHEDRVYLFLPLSHTFGGIYNLLACVYFGMELYLCSDTDKIFEELQMAKPSIFCAVPLIYERIYTMLGGALIEEAQMNQNESAIQTVRELFGGSIKYLFCGGAKQNVEIRKFYKDIGFCMLEAYALTETASSLSIEYADSKSVASVGTVFEDIEVKSMDPDKNGHGEILVKGENVALGYYKNENETRKAFSTDGYFHTGDIGYIDEGNQLFFVGRKKRVIVFSNGENIYPDEIEELIIKDENIRKVKVFEKNNGLAAELYVKSEIDASGIIESVNITLPSYKQIKSFDVIIDSIDSRMK